MSDQPEPPTTPADEPSETVTSPAGAQPPVPMRVPKHGHGKLYVAGVPGNKGGGRLPQKVLSQLVEICGLTCDELLERLNDAKVRGRMSADSLRLILGEALPYFLARKYEHAGPEGGPIPLEMEAVQKTVAESLRQRLHTRELLLHPPTSEAAPTAPEHRPVAEAPF